MAGDPVRHAERTGQERPVRVLHDQEPARDERPRRAQPCPSGARRAARPDQLQGEADARPAARDVVVEVPVQPFEARVEVRRERHEQELHVERLEPERADQPAEAHVDSRGLSGVRIGLDHLQVRRRGRVRGRGQERRRGSREHLVDLGVRDVQPAEPVVRVRVGRSPPVHCRADPRLDQLETSGEVTDGRVGDGHREAHRGPPIIDAQGRG